MNSKIKSEYFPIFEILISSNNSKKLSDILKIFHKIVEKKYIDKDIFNYFLKSEIFRKYVNKYLKLEQIDIINIDEYLVK
ncbi:hypothetical protein [Aliarcobacter butzleri]|uniref:Uncharacterized protein n=3 Tax=Aliarcobacter butzleri TaxID=28197 RepID=A0AAW7QAQ1_9BACT|nr:hypothetical protein [Aliarcobacter butzleri]KLE10893.1 hypothetical protein AF80_03030 [Aliarcobacter butzleri L355]MCG3653530.1 hypothetical protein [Aliarcobacter butzleri]MCG3699800.1 hypothetical protein [Aliarcobacter butzleri]MCT7618865.1 hypothetical protein [Aliarcobacter butzleri]MCT7638294.1 hypothetical protein [Aliarcobacter butzleri]